VERQGVTVPGSRARPTAIVADDEPALAEELCERLREAWPQLDVRAVARDGVEALRCLDEHRPDILFLDIEMPRASGLEVARRANGRCHVVFVTAFDHYAVAAFDEGAIDYLRKPFSAARLHETIARLRQRLAEAPGDLGALLDILAARKPFLRWLNASRGQETSIVTVDEVIYFKAEDKYTVVVTAGGESLVRKTIKELAAELDPEAFWQIHRSTIVNAREIAAVSRDFRGHMHLKLKSRPESLHVAETYHHRFRQS
jgi:DNA-binding LytR/AlgR family response regulator